MKLNRIFCLSFFTIISFTGAKAFSKTGRLPASGERVENWLCNKIFSLAEVRRLDKDLKKYNANASIWVVSKPKIGDSYYTIYVGYNRALRYDTRYNFRIKQQYTYGNNFEQHLECWNGYDKYLPLLELRKITAILLNYNPFPLK